MKGFVNFDRIFPPLLQRERTRRKSLIVVVVKVLYFDNTLKHWYWVVILKHFLNENDHHLLNRGHTRLLMKLQRLPLIVVDFLTDFVYSDCDSDLFD